MKMLSDRHGWVLLLTILLPTPMEAANIEARSAGWSVRLANEQECSTCPASKTFEFEVNRLDHNETFRFAISNMTYKIKSISIVSSKVVVLGDTHYSSIVTVYDLEKRKHLDELYCYEFSSSPNGRYLAYVKFYPAHGDPEVVSDVVLVYDFSLSPEENSVPRHKAKLDGENAGIPLFPKENKEKLALGHVLGGHYSVSRIAWSPTGKKFGFAAQKARSEEMMSRDYATKTIMLGIVDLSEGVAKAKTYVRRLPMKALLRPEHGSARVKFFADELRVSDDGSIEVRAKTRKEMKPTTSINPISEHDETY